MPLRSISGDQAFANLRANRTSLWPDGRKDRTRLSGIAEVAFEPGFQLVQGETVFTVGSCFARNIEQRLLELDFDVPACELTLPSEERASDTENDFLNKYPPHSILNEFRWALDPASPFPEAGLVEVKPGLWHDLHSAPNLKPAPLERVRKRRAMVGELYARLPSCRVIVMTLGLVEAWFDQATGHYLNGAPPADVLQADPQRFRLDVLTVDEIYRCLEEIYALLERFGHPDFRILLTVSPVPMRTTFTGRDAIAANTYSKSALRAAAEMFVWNHPRADYFPSYEIVTHTIRSSAFIQDNRHVTPQLVNVIVDRVVEAYCPEATESGDEKKFAVRRAQTLIRTAVKRGNFARAAELYAGLDYRQRYERAGYDEYTFRYNYGRILLRLGSMAEAQAELARAVELNPASAEATFQLARALARLQRPLDAEKSFRRAVELAPEAIVIRLGLANQLAELGEFDAALAEIRTAREMYPEDARADAALESVQTRMAARQVRPTA